MELSVGLAVLVATSEYLEFLESSESDSDNGEDENYHASSTSDCKEVVGNTNLILGDDESS